MNINLKETIDKIKFIKNDKKITNEQLSKESGIPLGTVNKILSYGTKSIKTQTLQKLLTALGLSFDDMKTNSEFLLENAVNFGFIKVGAYTPEIKLGSAKENAKIMIDAILKADEKGILVLAFPELSLTGSTLGDLYYQPTLLNSSLDCLKEIALKTSKTNVLSVIGMPLMKDGKIYSVAGVVYAGKILGFSVNSSVKLGGVFSRYCGVDSIVIDGVSYPFGNIVYKNTALNNLSFTIDFATDLLTLNPPSQKYSHAVDFSICLGAVKEGVGLQDKIKSLLSAHTSKLNLGLVFCNSGYGESTTNAVYSGVNYIYENGKILNSSKPFTSGFTISDIDYEFLRSEKSKNQYLEIVDCSLSAVNYLQSVKNFALDRTFEKYPFIPKTNVQERLELILNIQANALKRRIEHTYAKKLVLGVSGGLDSTLALIVCVRAMKLLNKDIKDIIAVTMPCFGTTSRTKNNAIDLSLGLGVTLKEISIKDAVTQHFLDIGHDIGVTDVTFENSQARERTQVLMDYANKVGGIVIGTGDLSELALGWATYNGDQMSMYGVNSSIPKTLLRCLVNYEASKSNKEVKKTLLDVLNTPVSPELIPPKEGEINQKTEDIVGPYILHDFYLYYAIRKCYSPKKIYYIAKKTFKNDYSQKELLKWLKNFYNRFFTQQFKRSCMPDGASVGSVSLSPRGDYAMPSDAYKTDWLEEVENLI